MTDLARLRELAEGATASPWENNNAWRLGVVIGPGSNGDKETDEWYGGRVVCESAASVDAAYIAAAHPAVVLGLLNRVEAMAAVVEAAKAFVDDDECQIPGLYEPLEAALDALEAAP